MAITFTGDMDELVGLLAAGGYVTRAIRSTSESSGRSADVYLENGVVVCWDSTSRAIWALRFSRRSLHVEKFLARMCAGPRMLRMICICQSRFRTRVQSWHHSTAAWLLRSEGLIARSLRQQISRS